MADVVVPVVTIAGSETAIGFAVYPNVRRPRDDIPTQGAVP